MSPTEQTEHAILAAALRDPAAIDNALALGLRDEHFVLRTTRAIWAGLVEDREGGIAPDEATLIDRHESNVGPRGAFASFEALSHLLGAVREIRPRVDLVPTYVARLAEQRARVLLESNARLVSQMVREGEPTAEAFAQAQQGLMDAERSRRTGFEFTRIGDLVPAAWDQVEAEREGRVASRQIKLGIRELDELLVAKPGDYVVIAGRPSMGKTQLALSALRHVTGRGVPALMVSLEMGRQQLVEGRIVSTEMATGRDRAAALEWWGRAPFFLDDRSLTLDEVCSSVRMHVLRHGVRVVVVDYIQIIDIPAQQSREREIAFASARLNQLKKDLDIVVIVLSQLSRGVEQRRDKRPLLSDLRESGAIEQDADQVVMMYRPAYYDSGTKEPHLLEALVRKQRNGKLGTASLHWELGKWVGSAPQRPLWPGER